MDTFSVKNPTGYYASPIANFTFDILSWKIKQIDADLYVSPNGNDMNLGISFHHPLKSISYALSIIKSSNMNPHTIFLDSGTYSPESTGTIFPLIMISNISIKGKGKNQTILDANKTGWLMNLNDCHNVTIEDVSFLNGYRNSSNGGAAGIISFNSNFVIANSDISTSICEGGECANAGLNTSNSMPILFNVTINDNQADGSVIGMYNCNPLLINVKITDNHFSWGNYIDDSNPLFINTEITNNSSFSSYGSSLMEFRNSIAQLINVTMSENSFTNNKRDYFLEVSDSRINIVNSILWNSSLKELTIGSSYQDNFSEIIIVYSNVKGGKEDISGLDENDILNWSLDNINLAPQFIDPTQKTFQLKPTSPCLDASDPNFDKDGITWETDPNDQDSDGTRMDMGANLDRNFSLMYGQVSYLSSGKPVTEVTITSSSQLQKQADKFCEYAVLLNPGVNEIIFEKPGYYPITITHQNNISSAIRFNAEFTKIGLPLNIITNELPEIDTNSSYSNRIRISGGTPPYKYKITDGSLPSGLTLNTDSGEITGIPSNVGSNLFSISVTDIKQLKAHMEFTINVVVPLAIISDYDLKYVPKNETYNFQFEITGNRLPNIFSINSGVLPPGLEITSEGLLTGTPTETGSYEFTIMVTDKSERIDTKTFKMVTFDPSIPLNITTGELPEVETGSYFNNRINVRGGTPPYDYNIAYGSLPAGMTFDNESGKITGTPNISGSYLFSVGVTDAIQAYAEMEFVIDVLVPLAIVSDYALKPAVVDEVYHFQFEATGDRLPNVFSFISEISPPGLELSSEGLLSGTPTESGTYEFEIKVMDNSERIDRKTFQLIVVDPISIMGHQSCYAIVGDAISLKLSATGGLGDLTWNVQSNNLPSGLIFENGLLYGSTTSPFENTVIIAVNDTIGNVAYKEVFLKIVGILEITTDALPIGVVDSPYHEPIQIKGGFPPYHFSFSGQLIEGLTLNNETGTISGSPIKGGTANFELTVTDSMTPEPKQVDKDLSIRITRGFTIITSARLPNAIKGQSIIPIQLSTIAGKLPQTWTITDSTIVEGIELNPETGELSGSAIQSGDFAFTVECTDADNNQTQKEFFWHISDPLMIQSPERIVVITNQNFMHMIDVFGGLRPFQWNIINGDPPEGLDLNPVNGVISGVAQSEQVSIITIQVTDNDYPTQTAQQAITIKVVDEFKLRGDFDKNEIIDLRDVIIGLRALSEMELHDDNFMLEDIVYLLTVLAGSVF